MANRNGFSARRTENPDTCKVFMYSLLSNEAQIAEMRAKYLQEITVMVMLKQTIQLILKVSKQKERNSNIT